MRERIEKRRSETGRGEWEIPTIHVDPTLVGQSLEKTNNDFLVFMWHQINDSSSNLCSLDITILLFIMCLQLYNSTTSTLFSLLQSVIYYISLKATNDGSIHS